MPTQTWGVGGPEGIKTGMFPQPLARDPNGNGPIRSGEDLVGQHVVCA